MSNRHIARLGLALLPLSALLAVLAALLVGAAACGTPGAAPPAQAKPVASESAALLADTLRWWVQRVLGSRDLSEWVLVVEAGPDSQRVVELMHNPVFTAVMPTDVQIGPSFTIDRQSGRKVCRFALAVTEVTDDLVYVTVSYTSGDRRGGSNRVELAPEASGWRVVSDTVLPRR